MKTPTPDRDAIRNPYRIFYYDLTGRAIEKSFASAVERFGYYELLVGRARDVRFGEIEWKKVGQDG